MSKIKEGLSRLFEKHRIIIWYDGEENFAKEFDEMDIADVRKAIIEKNEFALKYKLLIENKKDKFLLYAKNKRPANEENWLLDIELSNHVFQTDQESMFLQELELPFQFRPWIKKHIEFFNSKERLKSFVGVLDVDDNEKQLTLKLLQVVIGSQSSSLDELLRAYSTAFVANKHENIDEDLKSFDLFEPFWGFVNSYYGYSSSNQGIYDFVLEVFQENFSPSNKESKVKHSEVILSGWKDARSFVDTFKVLSERVEKDLNIKNLIEDIPIDNLVSKDLFECIDKEIIKDLTSQIIDDSINVERVNYILKKREFTFWYERYQPFYNALSYAALLMDEVKKNSDIKIEDFNHGFKQYTIKWYLIDQYYRLFIENYRATNQNNVLSGLYERVHKVYSNSWLLTLSDKWQKVIDEKGEWYFGGESQDKFFARDIKPNYIDKNVKVFVVISDALRYECGNALHDLFNEERRFVSRIEYQVTGLPSYTQLGMASLIPHTTLSLGEGDSILIDGKSTMGTQSRKKILEENSKVRATTILAEDLMKMSSKSEDAQNLIQNHDLIYVYHNRIDKVGDDRTSEDKVIEAAKEEIKFLLDLARKITNMNAYHIVFTADHGFVYQNEILDESDFTDAKVEGDIVKDSRRFVIGSNLSHNNSVVKFKARDLNLDNDTEILIPKGIGRLRVKGAGSRFVHGGATLQETVVPVLFVSKKKTDTVSKVEVDILNKSNNRITTNIHNVKFYQTKPISDEFIGRTIKSYFAILDGSNITTISNVFTFTFEFDSSRPEDREQQNTFTLNTKVKQSQDVYLMLEEKVEGTNKWNLLSKYSYSLNLAMGGFFDEF